MKDYNGKELSAGDRVIVAKGKDLRYGNVEEIDTIWTRVRTDGNRVLDRIGENLIKTEDSPTWISVSERLPERMEDIFVTVKDEKLGRFYGCSKGYLLIDDIKRGENYIDYWMPVPKID